MATIKDLQKKWSDNVEGYKKHEVGSGVHSFIADMFESPEIFALKKTATKTGKFKTFVHDTESNKEGRSDFVLYLSQDIEIPVEAKCYTRIEEGIQQLFRYQIGMNKQFGILTDGYEWRFYRGSKYQKWTQAQIFADPQEFLTFWNEYLLPDKYYIELFNPSGQMNLPWEESRLDLNDPENLKVFFEDTTKLIEKFKYKMKQIGVWSDLFELAAAEKVAVETSYAYLIQFILYKVLVDNKYTGVGKRYEEILRRISKAIQDSDFYSVVINDIKAISEYISENIYVPFKKEQESITEKLAKQLKANPKIDDISPWLDIIAFINKYDFAGLKNEIFGFIYENFLKELHGDKNKGQYFTDRDVVNFMLKELGYTDTEIRKRQGKDLSIIDPSCGAGTFLYSAVDNIINGMNFGGMVDTEQMSKHIEDLVSNNIFGLDIEEFPLYLAEMSILMRMLPLIVNDKFQNPIDNKFKLFKTKDSISEFLDAGINAKVGDELDLFAHMQGKALGYPSFMRDEKDLEEMMESLQIRMGHRSRFDFVIGNPPYVGLNKCYKENVPFAVAMRDRKPDGTKQLYMNDVYGVNLHSIPNKPKKGRPNPNLYAFFIALGLALLKEKGKICYIIPQTILVDSDYDVLRYHLSKNTTIEKMITFEARLFIGRGITQTRLVPTSSLIFVVKKEKPLSSAKTKIITYYDFTEQQKGDFAKYLKSRNKAEKIIEQSALLENVANWSFIKQDDAVVNLINVYKANTEDIAFYHLHKLAEDRFGSNFWFDGGYGIDERQIKPDAGDYIYPKINNKYYTIKDILGYWDNVRQGKSKALIALRQGNQGYHLLDSPYKIIWSYANTQKFFFTDEPVIWARNQYNAIGSDNRDEILYLFSLLNSKVSDYIIKHSFKLVNEDTLTIAIGLKNIKFAIRTPKISQQNQLIKDEIIAQADALLSLENVVLRDMVNLNQVQIQRFDEISVSECSLILSSARKKTELELPDIRTGELVVKAISEYYGDKKGNLQLVEITLSDLKVIPVIDFEKQSQIKAYIDDLVFALYFNMKLPKLGLSEHANIKKLCQQNEFYACVNGESKAL
ncbi:MAG: N-6 DNA methylase [Betaproteobacteria bacterium]|nr:N-6 DNA methylase [Betaproteobacteria bacterium]